MAAYEFASDFANLNNSLANLGKTLQEREATQSLLAAFDQAGGLGPTQQMARAQPLASLGATQPANYFAQTRAAESSGNDAAQNPRSTANGRYQFLQGTWNDLMKSNPELGLTADGRSDPAQQERAMRAFTAQNAQVLQSKGIQPTDGNLYMTHFLGAGAAPNFISAVQQDPTVPAASLVSPQAAAANRSVFYKPDGTPRAAGEVYSMMTRRFGDGSTAVAALGQADMPAPGAVQTEGQMPQPPMAANPQNTNSQMVRSLLANPSTRAAGLQLWQQLATGKQFGFQVVGDQLYRTNAATGMVEPVGVSKPATPMTLSEGQMLVDPRTGSLIAKGPDKVTKPVPVSEGGTLVNPDTGETVYQAPVGGKARQEVATREQIADQQGYQGEDRKFYIANGRLPTAGEKTTEGQANAALYADRMREADKILSSPEISAAGASTTQRLMSNLPGGNFLNSPQYQMADQAQRDFINAVLRRESGAAIAQSEFDNARKQYFPQPGDSKEVLAQKARNRQIAIQGISNAAGPAYAKRQAQSQQQVPPPAQQQPGPPQPPSPPTPPAQFREGQRASDGTRVIIFRNGQWEPE